MSNKSKGDAFERIIAEKLKKQGYTVELTPKSGDFGADIIARKGNKKIAIQVKNQKKPAGVRAVHEALGGKLYYKCNEAWVVSRSGFTKSAEKLARKARVKLITAQELGISGDVGSSKKYSRTYSGTYSRRYSRTELEDSFERRPKNRGLTNAQRSILLLIGIAMILTVLWVDYHYNYSTKPTTIVDSPKPTIFQNPPSENKNTPLLIELPAMSIPEIQNKTVLFFDDFENYKAGSLMGQQNGWFPVWGWSGRSFEQKVVANISVSGNKFFQLWGDPCRSAGYHRYFYFEGKYLPIRKINVSIGMETYIGIEGYGNPKCGERFEDNATTGFVGFWNSYDQKYYALVEFKRDGGIYANGVLISRWEPRKWYHVRIIMNWQKGVFDVYINGEKAEMSIPLNKFNARYYIYDGIIVGSGHAGIRVFLDDFAIFIVNETEMLQGS
ncbi:MAG: Uncharacterized protein XD43_1198 [Thermococcales archaeon 44_46]|nr:MAG: Uncharacterized protein XD43_1198 [Thermococcales archaeon 44_46]HIH73038.1 restriction endonuclease [Thermococcaceae archaeon]